jgi:transcriptional regulator with XRE-family HTH domain
MGSPRRRPARLAEKLLQIRFSLGLSQKQMLKRLGVQDQIRYTSISKYELDKNEPPLGILLAYARVAQVHLEEIIDDEIDLPRNLPGTFNYEAVKKQSNRAQ